MAQKKTENLTLFSFKCGSITLLGFQIALLECLPDRLEYLFSASCLITCRRDCDSPDFQNETLAEIN